VFTLEREAANEPYLRWLDRRIGLLVVMGWSTCSAPSYRIVPPGPGSKQPSTPQVVVVGNLTPSLDLRYRGDATPVTTPRARPTRRPEPTPARRHRRQRPPIAELSPMRAPSYITGIDAEARVCARIAHTRRP